MTDVIITVVRVVRVVVFVVVNKCGRLLHNRIFMTSFL